MPRATDLGIRIGQLPHGATDSVLDVPGVGLGHCTVWRDEPDPPLGRGVARTGVSVLVVAEDAVQRLVPAGGAVLNGFGECTGFITAAEWGLLRTPVFLTSTMQLGRVYDAACELSIERCPQVAEDVIIPMVAECDDSFLSDARRMQVTHADVATAWSAALASRGASPPPPEGSVGSGTGMSCLGFKGGIGTASRVTPEGHVVAVLLMTNFGDRARLTVDGVPVGRLLPAAPTRPAPPAGSCIGVVVTDAAVDGSGCQRLARRVGLGLARTGSVARHGSGEIFLAAATGLRTDPDGRFDGRAAVSGRDLDPLFEAVVDATEEAVLNSLLASPTVIGRNGNTSEGLPVDAVAQLLRAHGRL
ncbi:MAG: P1 family peptidase [Nocardioidaceae bacterium]|nr:P1 family peptidase [Nocardioidaceae bacterium]